MKSIMARSTTMESSSVSSLALGFLALVSMLTGCHSTQDNSLRTTRRIVRVPTHHEGKLAEEFADATRVTGTCERVAELAEAALESDYPYLVGCVMLDVSGWAQTDDGRKEAVRLLIRNCLSSDDALIRLAGVFAAGNIEDRDIVRTALSRDASCLLVAPVPPPWWAAPWWSEVGRSINRLQPAQLLLVMRERVIALVGEYDVQAARPILEVITADENEHAVVRETARDALASLDRKHEACSKSAE